MSFVEAVAQPFACSDGWEHYCPLRCPNFCLILGPSRQEEATMSAKPDSKNKPTPFINVTPLIDVLLVLLIIFMVAAPLKPNRFLAKLPSELDGRVLPPNPKTLVVTIEQDGSLRLNNLTGMGSID